MAAIVIDNGSGKIKVGYAGNDVPTAVFSAAIGKIDPERIKRRLLTSLPREQFIGEEAQKARGILSLQFPVERAIIKDWHAMELIWGYAFASLLKTRPDKQALVITSNPSAPKKQHSQVCDAMFEKFGVPAVSIGTTGLLALSGANRSTGLVVDSGDSVTNVTPVIDGRVKWDSVMTLNYAGRDLNSRFAKLLAISTGVDLGASSAKLEIARAIKQKLCFVSCDYKKDSKNAKTLIFNENYILPDMNELTVGEERFHAPEALFGPGLGGLDSKGIQVMAYEAINKASGNNEKTRRTLFSNVILSGGTTAMRGFATRLKDELREQCPVDTAVNVTAPPQQHYLAWLGAAKTAVLPDFVWLTKLEYEESGPSAIFRKFSLS